MGSAALLTVAVLAVVTFAAPTGAGSVQSRPIEPSATNGRHCTVTVVDQLPSGELVTGPMECGDESPLARSAGSAVALASVIAIHYVDINFGGASLTVQGGVCNGGWLNLPVGWVNTISSTWSPCTTQHYDLFNLAGAVESLSPGGGNLGALHDRANSVRYI